MFIMIIALIALFLVLICVGRYPISPFRAFEIIGRSFVGKTDGMDVYESSVILSIRLPRILLSSTSRIRRTSFRRSPCG